MSSAMLHGMNDCTPALHCGCLSAPSSPTPVPAVWVVIENVRFADSTLALLADSLESAKKGAAKYVGEESLAWDQRNSSTLGSQDYFVAEHDGDEYHVYQQEVEHHADT